MLAASYEREPINHLWEQYNQYLGPSELRCMDPILYLVHRFPFPPDKGDRIRAFHILKFLAKRRPTHLAILANESVCRESRAALAEFCEKLAIVPLPRTRLLHMLGSTIMGKTVSKGAFDSPVLRQVLNDWSRDTHNQARSEKRGQRTSVVVAKSKASPGPPSAPQLVRVNRMVQNVRHRP